MACCTDFVGRGMDLEIVVCSALYTDHAYQSKTDRALPFPRYPHNHRWVTSESQRDDARYHQPG